MEGRDLLNKFVLLFFVLSIININIAAAQEKKGITIIYTNDVGGEIEPCG